MPKHDADIETLPARSIRILVVEDDPNLRTAVCTALQRRGFQVELAFDGLIAIEKFRSSPHEFDVVLLDMTLPRMPGLEVLGEMRRIRPGARIVLTSANNVDVRNLSVERHHPVSFIQKPYRLTELVEQLFREIGSGSESVKR